jgi:hypothetical protein
VGLSWFYRECRIVQSRWYANPDPDANANGHTDCNGDSDSDSDRNANTCNDSAHRSGEKGGGNKYIASQMEGGDLGQRRYLPQWKCDRDNDEQWIV